jgi:hypothetical protein
VTTLATEADLRALTQAYRTQQVQRAAIVAALVAAYYRSRVDVEDPAAIERWLDLMLPRIMGQQNIIARLAAEYANKAREIELPREPKLTFDPLPGSVEEQIRTSLRVVGPVDYTNKMRDIQRLDIGDQQREAMAIEAKQITAKKVAASVVRHTQAGGRETLLGAAKSDRVALGHVRVTTGTPCFFCAMLASRGLVYNDDSFNLSDSRFTGDGKVKVHDSCACTLKPVYRRDDPLVQDSATYTDLWERWGAGGGNAMLRFRRGYDHWRETGEYLDWDVVNDSSAFYGRNSAA